MVSGPGAGCEGVSQVAAVGCRPVGGVGACGGEAWGHKEEEGVQVTPSFEALVPKVGQSSERGNTQTKMRFGG